jgi:hypothetical protein
VSLGREDHPECSLPNSDGRAIWLSLLQQDTQAGSK